MGLLLKSFYGTRDAASNWEAEVRRVMCSVLGFRVGKTSPCIFFHKERELRCSVHGDDFAVLGRASDFETSSPTFTTMGD